MERNEKKAHREWRRSVAAQLPDLTARTFALRGKMYMGCGFHYALEKTLGKVISMANDDGPLDIHTAIIDEVIFEGFVKDLGEAEASALDWEKTHAA